MLNVGSIPSKSLLHSTELFAEVREGFEEHGIGIGGVALNLCQLIARRDQVVEDLTKGVADLSRKNKVERVQGSAVFETTDLQAPQPASGGCAARAAGTHPPSSP